MGMDSYIYLAHSKKELENDNFWSIMPPNVNEDEKWSTIGERWYARKFLDLHIEVVEKCFNGDYECGDWVELTREDIDVMIKFASHNPDYWDGFKSVPSLCDIWYHWDDIESAGLKVFYECDW